MKKLLVLAGLGALAYWLAKDRLGALAYWLAKDRLGGEPDEFVFTEAPPAGDGDAPDDAPAAG